MLKDKYLSDLYSEVVRKNPAEPEYHQATLEVLESLEPVIARHPEYCERGVIDLLLEPERVIKFRVPWLDDQGKTRVNRGYRVQYNGAMTAKAQREGYLSANEVIIVHTVDDSAGGFMQLHCYIYQVPEHVSTKRMLKFYAHELPK